MEEFVDHTADRTNLDFEHIAEFCGGEGEDIVDYIGLPSNNPENANKIKQYEFSD